MPEPIYKEFSMLVQEYILYLRNVRGLGEKTVREYSKDLRTFFRFLKRGRGLVPGETPLEEILVNDVDLEFIRSISTYEVYSFMNYVVDERNNMASTRQRKSTTLRSFFRYLTTHEKLLDSNPAENLSTPKKPQNAAPLSLPGSEPGAAECRGWKKRPAGPLYPYVISQLRYAAFRAGGHQFVRCGAK